MSFIFGTLQLGLIYGLLAVGIYISFRVLNIPDLTAEGSFTFGLAVSSVMAAGGHSWLGILCAALAGAAAGAVTALLQTRLKIHPVLAGILTMSGLYSINMYVMGERANVTLIGCDTIFTWFTGLFPSADKNVLKLIIAAAAAVIGAALAILFFRTHLGLCVRAAGDNETMVRASSINVDRVKLIALAVSNAYIALCGGIIAQYQSFADINSGVGILVVGLASVIIGEVIVGRRGVTAGVISAVAGSLAYRIIIALATRYTLLPAYMLKLISAVIVAAALSVPAIRQSISLYKTKRGGV